MSQNPEIKKRNPGQMNSVQLNVITVVDLHKAVRNNSLKDTFYMMDNSVGGLGQGTPMLQTACKQGQVINWIIYPMDVEKRPDGAWPPMPKIINIVFLDDDVGDREEVAESKVMTELKVYGGPDKMRNPFCPVYYYWAGAILPDLPPGNHPYRLVIELQKEECGEKITLSSDAKPSLKVLEI